MHARTLHRGPTFAVRDVHCGGGPRHAGPEETTDTAQIVLVRSGLFVRCVGRETVVADPTRAIFYRRGEVYRTAHPTGAGDRCTTIEIEAAAGALPLSAPTTPADDLAHRRLVSALERRALSALEADEAVLDLVHRIVAHARREPREPVPCRRGLADRARQLIAARFVDALRLDLVARELGCSPFHLCRVFRSALHVTLGRYQARLRVRAALERLSAGERDLTLLALDLGFYDHSHFCRVFRRETGCAPSAWRSSKIVQARPRH